MIIIAEQYHDQTSYERLGMSGHLLDWENQPQVYKSYPGVTPFKMTRNAPLQEIKLSELLKQVKTPGSSPPPITLSELSLLFHLTCCLTAKSRQGGGEFYFRSVASAGALYPVEIYAALRGVSGLEDGLYHFSILHHGLNLLRNGDPSMPVVNPQGPAQPEAAVLAFFFSAIFFRSAWKYRERAYRYHLLDTGHLVEHLLLAAAALHLPLTFSYDFDDDRVNHFLGVDEAQEAALALCSTNRVFAAGAWPETMEALPEKMKMAGRVSDREIGYDAVNQMHQAGQRIVSGAASNIRMIDALGVTADQWTPMETLEEWPEKMSYARSVCTRRSRRNFIREPLKKSQMAALLEGLCADEIPASALPAPYHPALCTGFITENIDGFDPGFYLLDAFSKSSGRIASGHFLGKMARICLDQAWLANASVHFLFMTNLARLERLWGPRGYRYAMMHAGRMGARLYLCATAMGIGACGIGAFYDAEASGLLGLNGQSRLLYLVSLGQVRGLE
ncbi:MAG: SagB/ThcOx family dehydrogenase [Desulfobacterales bacterium]|nr:SagB/ThcOx family dehydrogenase [Desulfobacterales bacterium]